MEKLIKNTPPLSFTHTQLSTITGWFVKSPVGGRVTAYVEFLRASRLITIASSREQYTVGIDQFNEFKLQSKLSDDLTAVSLVATALARLDVGDFVGAISRFTSAIEIPVKESQLIDVGDIYVFRGLTYLYQANATGAETMAQALADCEQAIKLNTSNRGAYLLRAYVLLLSGKDDEPLAEGKKLLESADIPTDRISIYAFLLQALDQQQDNMNEKKGEEAKKYSKEILAVTENRQFASADTYFQRAMALDVF